MGTAVHNIRNGVGDNTGNGGVSIRQNRRNGDRDDRAGRHDAVLKGTESVPLEGLRELALAGLTSSRRRRRPPINTSLR